jgi:hypothetical protein
MPVRTIDRESKQFITAPIDFERMGDRFKTGNGYYSFPNPSLKLLEDNLFYLLRNSEEIKFDAKYDFRPDYLSFDKYGTVVLDKFILFVNSINRPEEFVNLDKIYLPSLDSIIKILIDAFPANKSTDQLSTIIW